MLQLQDLIKNSTEKESYLQEMMKQISSRSYASKVSESQYNSEMRNSEMSEKNLNEMSLSIRSPFYEQLNGVSSVIMEDENEELETPSVSLSRVGSN